jgi:hypothetical protein
MVPELAEVDVSSYASLFEARSGALRRLGVAIRLLQ